jgi:hypothetical protein
MSINWRRKEARAGARDPMYSPERDIAHIGPGLIRQAMLALDEQWYEPWFQEFATQYGVTEEDLGEAAVLFAKACNEMIQLKNPVVALEANGFAELPPPLQMAIYTKIGQVFLTGVWAGCKDLATPTSAPPADIEELLEVADTVMRHFANLRQESDDSHEPASDNEQ